MMSPHLAMRQRLRSGEREIILLVEEEGESYVFEFNADIGLYIILVSDWFLKRLLSKKMATTCYN